MEESKDKKIVIGLTGGIASGKSFVAEVWRSLGADVVSCDVLARSLTEAGGEALDLLKTQFATAFDDGVLNRSRLRTMVFQNPEQLAKLNAIMHPLIRQKAVEQAEKSTARVVVVEAPLLFEAGFKHLVDKTVCTLCSTATQIERLCMRDGCDMEQAKQILSSQMETAKKAALCDFILDTDVPATELVADAASLFSRF